MSTEELAFQGRRRIAALLKYTRESSPATPTDTFRFFDLPPELRRSIIDQLEPDAFLALALAGYDQMRRSHRELVPHVGFVNVLGIIKSTGNWEPNGLGKNMLARGMLPNEVLLLILQHLPRQDQLNFAIALYPMLHWCQLVPELDQNTFLHLMYGANPALR